MANQYRKNSRRRAKKKVSEETKKPNLSRRKKAKARTSLDKALDSLVQQVDKDSLLKNRLFLEKKENKLIVGAYCIERTPKGLFNIFKKKDNTLIYKDLYSFDAAMALVESLNVNRKKAIPEILEAEEAYCKNYLDMLYLNHAYRLAINENSDNIYILEDRCILVKDRLEKAQNKLRAFRIT